MPVSSLSTTRLSGPRVTLATIARYIDAHQDHQYLAIKRVAQEGGVWDQALVDCCLASEERNAVELVKNPHFDDAMRAVLIERACHAVVTSAKEADRAEWARRVITYCISRGPVAQQRALTVWMWSHMPGLRTWSVWFHRTMLSSPHVSAEQLTELIRVGADSPMADNFRYLAVRHPALPASLAIELLRHPLPEASALSVAAHPELLALRAVRDALREAAGSYGFPAVMHRVAGATTGEEFRTTLQVLIEIAPGVALDVLRGAPAEKTAAIHAADLLPLLEDLDGPMRESAIAIMSRLATPRAPTLPAVAPSRRTR
jgi:hypothetical protein